VEELGRSKIGEGLEEGLGLRSPEELMGAV
jgi:hypothetical protein